MINKIDAAPGLIAPATTQKLDRASGDRSQPVSAAPPADNVRLTAEAAGLEILQRQFAANPSIDVEKVMALREAVQSGSYRIDPAAIADGLLRIEQDLAG
ncbi:MAG: flagellar biosynthesis anti-sigma factor FlgM [Xanthomonadaceae bacterium]|nr:flagellar biosynthesis anti-sigma factor FlgM [Xanthomonadaceae bacterium]